MAKINDSVKTNKPNSYYFKISKNQSKELNWPNTASNINWLLRQTLLIGIEGLKNRARYI